jgi:ferredoxin
MICSVACDGCARCARDAPDDLITMEDGLAVIDYEKNELAHPEIQQSCPTGAIVWVEGEQFSAGDRPAVESERRATGAG